MRILSVILRIVAYSIIFNAIDADLISWKTFGVLVCLVVISVSCMYEGRKNEYQ